MCTTSVARTAGSSVAANQGYKHTTEKHIIPYFRKANLKLHEIDQDTVQAFSNYLSKKGNLKTGGALSGKSVRNYLTVLSQIFNDAVEKKKIAETLFTASSVRRNRNSIRAFTQQSR